MTRPQIAVLTGILAVALALGVAGLQLRRERLAQAAKDPVATPAASHTPWLRADGVVVARTGARVTLRSEVAGTVKEALALRGQQVHRGDVLVRIDSAQQAAALREAVALAGEAQTTSKWRATDYKRSRELVASGALPQKQLDDATSERRSANARAAAATAAAERLRIAVQKTTVVAPIDGTVVARTVEVGETLAVGAALFEIADLSKLRVEAEVDEFYVGHVSVGAAVEITAEAFVGQVWNAQIEEIGDAVVPRRLRPLDPSRPGDVGVLQVWVSLPPGTPLKLGQRVQIGAATAPSQSPTGSSR